MLLQRIQNCLKDKTKIANVIREGLKAHSTAPKESTSAFVLLEDWKKSLPLDKSPLFDLCFSHIEKLKNNNQLLVLDFGTRLAECIKSDATQDGFKLTETDIFDGQATLKGCSIEKSLDEFEYADFDEFLSLFSEAHLLAGISNENSMDIELLYIAMQIYHLLDKDIKLSTVKAHFSMQPEALKRKEYTQGQLELCCQIGCLFKLMTEVKKPYQAQPVSNGILSWLSSSSSSTAATPASYKAQIKSLLEEIQMNATVRMDCC